MLLSGPGSAWSVLDCQVVCFHASHGMEEALCLLQSRVWLRARIMCCCH